MTEAPRGVNAAIDREAPVIAARIFAWAGARDEATALLEHLSTRFPGVGPAEITRDPLYAVPLAGNARFQSLALQLEKEITANVRLFDSPPAMSTATMPR